MGGSVRRDRNTMTLRPHLVIFAREPRMGRSKTRLARDIDVIGAWRFARGTLAALTRRLRSPRWQCWLACTPVRPAARRAAPRGWQVVGQGRGDLGCRLLRTMRRLPAGAVVIVGSDAPEITPGHITAALRALGAADYVLGPAGDGGFWLIGAAGRARAGLDLRGVRWSTATALKDTLGCLGTRRVQLVSTLDDVDDGAAFAAWRQRAQAQRGSLADRAVAWPRP